MALTKLLKEVERMWTYLNSNSVAKENIVRNFRRNFPTLMVSIQIRDLMPNDEEIIILDERNEMILRSLNTCDRYIKFFGPGITRMTINYVGLNEITSQRLNQLIVQSCAENLREIRFIGIRIPLIDGLTSLPRVQQVLILDSDLGSQIRFFYATLFPNVRKLEMENVRLDDCRAYFEHLEHFRIKSNSHEMEYGVRKAANLWYDSENLQSLEIDMFGDSGMLMQDLLNSINTIESLSMLSVNTGIVGANVTRQELDNLIESHPELIELRLYSYMFSMDNVVQLINRLTSLQYFAFQKTLGDSLNEDYIADLEREVGYNWQVIDGDGDSDFIVLLRNGGGSGGVFESTRVSDVTYE